MQTFLPELAELLRAATSHAVHASPPTPETEGVFVWAWRFGLDQSGARSFRPSGLPPVEALTLGNVELQLVIVVQQAEHNQALSTLATCSRVISSNALLRDGASEGHLVLTHLPLMELCSLLTSSGVRMQPCLTLSLTIFGASF